MDGIAEHKRGFAPISRMLQSLLLMALCLLIDISFDRLDKRFVELICIPYRVDFHKRQKGSSFYIPTLCQL